MNVIRPYTVQCDLGNDKIKNYVGASCSGNVNMPRSGTSCTDWLLQLSLYVALLSFSNFFQFSLYQVLFVTCAHSTTDGHDMLATVDVDPSSGTFCQVSALCRLQISPLEL